MSSSQPGEITSAVEVTDISVHGIWILVRYEELFLPYEEFPWFKQASVSAVFNVRLESPEHLYWPELDVDLSLESIRHPERFPLKAKA
jgi:hypothetical protein